jgi:hypothetical protein
MHFQRVSFLPVLAVHSQFTGFELPEAVGIARHEFDDRLARMLDGMATRRQYFCNLIRVTKSVLSCPLTDLTAQCEILLPEELNSRYLVKVCVDRLARIATLDGKSFLTQKRFSCELKEQSQIGNEGLHHLWQFAIRSAAIVCAPSRASSKLWGASATQPTEVDEVIWVW